MAGGFCPQCGTQRTSSLRYCASCGFDFSAGKPMASSTPTPQRSLARATIRAQAQNVFSRLAAIVGFFVGAAAWRWLTYGALADSNPLLWFFGAIVAGLIAGWALGTAVMLWLA